MDSISDAKLYLKSIVIVKLLKAWNEEELEI
jgi:hypothetical protein